MSNSSSWWANKLGTQAPAERPAAPVAPAAQPAPSYQQAPSNYPQVSVPPAVPPQNPELEGHRLPQSAGSYDRCPNCASGNYGRTTPESRARCYDCGYPIQQSGSGVPGVRVPTEGPVQAARQVGTGGFNPQQIVDRIG